MDSKYNKDNKAKDKTSKINKQGLKNTTKTIKLRSKQGFKNTTKTTKPKTRQARETNRK